MDGFLDCSYLMDNSLDNLSIFIVISGWAVILSSCEGIFYPGYWSAPLLNRLGLAIRVTCVFRLLLSVCNVSNLLEHALVSGT